MLAYYFFFKSIVSTLFPLILIFLIAQLSLVKNCPWRNEVKSKSLSFSEKPRAIFHEKFWFFPFLIILIILIILRPMKATASKAYRGHILTDWLLHTDRLTTSYWQIDYFILTDWLLHTDMIFYCQHNTWKRLVSMTNNLIVKSNQVVEAGYRINNQWTAFNFAWYFKNT